MIGRKRLHTKINNQLCSLFCFTMILNQCMTITANLVVPKHGISLSEIQRLNLNEFGSETDELVFQYEIELAWDEIRMKQANHEEEVYPFLACHSNSELSGYDRRLELAQFLGLSTIEADKWNVLSNDKEKTCFIATLDTDISMLRERNDSVRWSQFRSKHMSLIPYTMHMKIRPHDNVSNTAGYRILTISLCDGILSDYRNFAAVAYVEELVTKLRIDASAMNQHVEMTSKIMNQKQFSLNLQEKSHKYRRALVNEQLAFVCQSLSYVVSQGPSENSVLFEIPNSKQTFECETYYLALLSSHSAFCSISSFDYIHQVKLANYEAQWIAQSGVPNYRPFWSNSLAGSNEIIGVVDDGLDIDNCYFYDPNISNMIKDGRFYANGRKAVQYVSSSGDDDTSDGDHGTFVAGTIAGSRIGDMPGLAEGIAKDARIAFFDIGTSAGISIPSNPSQLYGSTLSNGAFVQNNSWTLNTNTYHAICASLDSFVFSNPNLVLVFAAGNIENDEELMDRQYTVTCPGIAKNVIAVGASQSIQGRSWYGSLGEDYIAPFSSAGPSLDGRIKPDIIAPGDYLLSANSKVSIDMECDPPAEYYISPFSASNYGIRYDKGTSVSAAVVSGAAAMVRQYFKEGWFESGEKGSGPPTTPSAALVKAVLLNGGKSLIGVETWNSLNSGIEVVSDYDHNQGYGRVNLLESLSLDGENGYKIFFVDNEIMQNGIIRVFNYQVADEIDSPGGSCSTMDASITLAWTDPAGSEGCLQCLVNNLDMLVIHTSIQNNESKTYYPNGRHTPDTVNNVERTRIPFYDAGDLLRVQISGNLSTSTQAFALVVRIGCLNNHPTSSPSLHPSFFPSTTPSKWPSRGPSSNPSLDPTTYPSMIPSKIPSLHPSFTPSLIPSTVPSRSPTSDPTKLPSIIPSTLPTNNPSEYPSLDLSNLPSRDPTFYPSMAPTLDPSKVASNSPSINPTISPSLFPSHIPSIRPSLKPSQIPSSNPSHSPSRKPSPFPISIPTKAPSITPSFLPSLPLSMVPSSSPSENPTSTPTDHPSIVTNMPTLMVSSRPSPQKSVLPTKVPSLLPTLSPIQTLSTQPSNVFSSHPTTVQSWNPSEIFSQTPTNILSVIPSISPTTLHLTMIPSRRFLIAPSFYPSLEPTLVPSQKITHHPSVRLSASPSAKPTQLPTFKFTDEHNHLGPSSKPSSKPTSTPSISNFPSMTPSNIDIAFPLIGLPTKSPSPSRFPSSQPSLTPPVISFVEIPYIRESNATGNEDIATNETELFYTTIYKDDLELYERLEYKYANNCTIDDCRRLEEEFRPINVLNVSTSVNETEVCIASNENYICHYLLTSVKVEHYPVQFSRKRVELEVLSKTLEYMDDRLIAIRPLIPVPQPLESSISITFIGVTASELDSVELVQLLDTTFNFLQDLLGEYDPPILMESIAFNKQTLTVEGAGVEENSVGGSRHLNITDSSPQITQANITIDITVRGEYLPPPVVDFGVVLVDIFDEENEEYIDEIEKSENTYFAGIIDKIKVVTKANDAPALNKNNDNSILGVQGLSIITSSSVLVIALCSACFYKKHLRKIKSNKAADDLRRQAMEIGKNDLSLTNNDSSMTLGQMNNLRVTHRSSTLNVPSGFDDIALSNTDDDGSRLRFSTTSNLSSESPGSSRRFSRQFNGNSFSNTFDTTRESRSPPIINAVIVEASDSNMVDDESIDGSTSSAIDID